MVFLIGRLGQDPEIKDHGGKTKVKFTLGTSEKYKDQEHTEWHNIISWGNCAEIIAKYCVKGMLVHLQGKNKTSSWMEGSRKNYFHFVEVFQVKLLEKKGDVPIEPEILPS